MEWLRHHAPCQTRRQRSCTFEEKPDREIREPDSAGWCPNMKKFIPSDSQHPHPRGHGDPDRKEDLEAQLAPEKVGAHAGATGQRPASDEPPVRAPRDAQPARGGDGDEPGGARQGAEPQQAGDSAPGADGGAGGSGERGRRAQRGVAGAGGVSVLRAESVDRDCSLTSSNGGVNITPTGRGNHGGGGKESEAECEKLTVRHIRLPSISNSPNKSTYRTRVPVMTLIVALHVPTSGELVIAGDRRVTNIDVDTGDIYMSNDDTQKLFEFKGDVIGVCGRASLILDTIDTERITFHEDNRKPHEHLGHALRDYFKQWHSGDRAADYKKWPGVGVLYAHIADKTLHMLDSRTGFMPERATHNIIMLAGQQIVPFTLFSMLWRHDFTLDQTIRLAVWLISASATILPTVSEKMDLWVVGSDRQITKKESDVIREIQESNKNLWPEFSRAFQLLHNAIRS